MVSEHRLPSTPVGEALEWTLARLLGGRADEAEMSDRFAAEFLARLPAATVSMTMGRAVSLLGDIDIAEVDELGPHRASVTVVGSTGMRARISATVEAEPPHRLTGLGLAPLPAPPASSPVRQRVILLNGASSSGKTAIAEALQTSMDDVWLTVSVDDFVRMLPARAIGDLERVVRSGHQAIAALVADGQRVIYDGPLGPDLVAHLDEALGDVDILHVGVRCDDQVLVAREAGRGDRMVGQAVLQNAAVHSGVAYDIEVDTTHMSPQDCASAITDRLS